MADTAAHLVDRVFPEVPVRQWVLSLPFGLRCRLAYDSSLLGEVLRIFVRAVFASIRRRAGIPASDGSSPAVAGEDPWDPIGERELVGPSSLNVSCLLLRQRHAECGEDVLLPQIRSWQTRQCGVGVNGVVQ